MWAHLHLRRVRIAYSIIANEVKLGVTLYQINPFTFWKFYLLPIVDKTMYLYTDVYRLFLNIFLISPRSPSLHFVDNFKEFYKNIV